MNHRVIIGALTVFGLACWAVAQEAAPSAKAQQALRSDDTSKLEKGVRDLRPGGGTSLFDAIFFSCRDKLQQDQPKHKFRRAMVILSDGEDNQSRQSRDQALEMAQKADVVIYAISTNISRIES